MSDEIEILVNDLGTKVPAGSTIAELIVRFREGDAHLIVELNGRFIYPQHYETTRVSAGDRIEFINPDFGG